MFSPTPLRVSRLQMPKNEIQNIQLHAKKAKQSLKRLRTKLMAVGVGIKKTLAGKDEKAQFRAAKKELASFRPVQGFLTRYLGKLKMDPSVKGARSRAIAALALYSLGHMEEDILWEKLSPSVAKGYEIIQMAQGQAGLRSVLPADLRQFLPKNLIVEVDETGHISGITDRFVNELETMKVKRERQKDLLLRYNDIVAAVRKDMASSNPRVRLAAIITGIVMETGIRPGQERNQTVVQVGDEKVAVQTFGATTLKAEHVQFVRDNFAQLEFVGKAGSTNRADITDPVVVKALRQFITTARASMKGGQTESPYLFVLKNGKQFNYGMLNHYWKKQAALQGLKITDFRKLKATQTVLANLRAAQEKLYAKIRSFVSAEAKNLKGRVVAEIQAVVEKAYSNAQKALSHEDVSTTVKSYVNPEILLRYLSRGGTEGRLEAVLLQGKDKLVLDVDKFIQNALKEDTKAQGKKASGFQENTLGALLEELEEDLAKQ